MEDKIITRIPPRVKFDKDGIPKNKRVAAYARVSTNSDEQIISLEAQKKHYSEFISEKPEWQFVNLYVDEGISGLSTQQRQGFNSMIEDCMNGKIDLIITKSISRFARNTVDTVSIIRKLKEKGVGVYFEKENIHTLDSAGEFILTLMSSLAQEESRSMSENIKWGLRKRFENGYFAVPYKCFLGYDRGKEKHTMVINENEARIVRKIFFMYIQGFCPNKIAKIFTGTKVGKNTGSDVWHRSSILHILKNEKYKGDALLQKRYTVDFLTKKVKKNEGELNQYYVTDSHEPIISPWLFDYVQQLMTERHDTGNYKRCATYFSGKVRCGVCGQFYGPRPWHSTSYNNKVWQCKNRIKKGEKCIAPNIYDRLLYYIIYDAARMTACKRGLMKRVMEIAKTVVSGERFRQIEKWAGEFDKISAWDLPLDDGDITTALKYIIVNANKTVKFEWIDRTETVYSIPEYIPRNDEILEDAHYQDTREDIDFH